MLLCIFTEEGEKSALKKVRLTMVASVRVLVPFDSEEVNGASSQGTPTHMIVTSYFLKIEGEPIKGKLVNQELS